MSSRSTPKSKGAVRLTARQKPQPMRHLTKLSLGLLAVAGGILITTQSNGTIDASKPDSLALPTQAESRTTFFFDDRDNALDNPQTERLPIVRAPFEDALPNTLNKEHTSPNTIVDETIVDETKPDLTAKVPMQEAKKLAVPESKDQSTPFNPIAPEAVIEFAAQRESYDAIVEELITESSKQGNVISRDKKAPETLPATTLLAMNTQTDSAAVTFQPLYTEQSQDTQAGRSDVNVNNPFLETDTTPKTTTIFNHPSIETIRQKTEFPEGATTESVTVVAGDTLSKVLNDRGVKMDQMPQLLTDDVIKQYLSNLDIGQTFQVVRLENGDFHSLSAKVGDERQVSIRRSDNGFATASIDLPLEKERVVTSGTIEQSLYVAADQANLRQSTIMELSDIFQWELDFARDIRKGDQFSLIYDRLYRDGKYIGDGDILAAQFVRGGKLYEAVRYTDPDGNTGYYSPDGRSKRRTFLRHPVDVVRITSKFDPKRVHPVLHKIRAHKGVDYGSPTGTPIRATADGIVRYAGHKSAYGNTVILSHGTDIRTLYAHMSRISDKVGNGKRVKQGDVIGYVGATGRVTGAHLHYEFQKNGNHVDPLKVELPAAQPLKSELRDALRELSEDLLAQMRSVVPDTSSPVVTTASK